MTVREELRLSDILAAYFSVPLLVSSIYGMNITLPLQTEWYAFLLYIAVSAVWAVIVTVVGMNRSTGTTDPIDRAAVRVPVVNRMQRRRGFERPSRFFEGDR